MLILTLVLGLNQFGHSVTINITGGPYQQNKYMNTHVILGYQGIGPKMCVEECMLHNGCNAVNFKRNGLTCELLILASTGAQPEDGNGIYYTAIDTWSKVSLPFHYHFLLKCRTKAQKVTVRYLYLWDIDLAPFNDTPIVIWNSYDSMVFFCFSFYYYRGTELIPHKMIGCFLIIMWENISAIS